MKKGGDHFERRDQTPLHTMSEIQKVGHISSRAGGGINHGGVMHKLLLLKKISCFCSAVGKYVFKVNNNNTKIIQ